MIYGFCSKPSLFCSHAARHIKYSILLSLLASASAPATPLEDWRASYLRIASLFIDTLSSPSGMFWDECGVTPSWGNGVWLDTAGRTPWHWAFEPAMMLGVQNQKEYFGENSFYHGDLLSDIHFGGIRARQMLNVDSRFKDDPGYPAHTQRGAAGRFGEDYLQLDNRYGFVRLGRLERNWGPFPDRSLVLSSNPYSYDAIEWQVHSRVFEFRHLVTWFLSRTDLDDFGIGYYRYLAAHALTIRPHRFISVGLFESVIFARTAGMPDLQYLNPFSSYVVINTNQEAHSVNGNQGGAGNAMLGFQWNINPCTDKIAIKGQFLIDDIQVDKESATDKEPNHLGGDFGIHLRDLIPVPIQNAAWIEYRFATPWLYTVRDYDANAGERYAYLGRSLGMESNDQDRISAGVAGVGRGFWTGTLEFAYQRQGENSVLTRWGDSEPGATPGLPAQYEELLFPTGTVEKWLDISVGLMGYWRDVADIQCGITNRWVTNKGHVPTSGAAYEPRISLIASVQYSGLFFKLPQW